MNRSNRINKNVPHHKRMKEFQTLSNQILQYASRGVLRPNFQREISKMILEFSGCDTVELWLKDHGKYYRCEVKRHPNQSFSFEISPCLQNEEGEIIPGPDDNPEWVSLCRDILRGHNDPSQPVFTLPLRSRPNRKSHAHGVNFGSDYRSLALIPLLVDNKNIGLLILKSKLRNFFSKDEGELYEDLAKSLGIALTHRHAQSDLRERVKELTCLYGIARLATQPNIPLEEILQNIAELLPPALLYPEITFSRILLDGRSYSIASFKEGYHQLRSDININGIYRGFVEVAYIEEKPELDEGPFLNEERTLIDTVASEIASIIKRRETEDHQLKLQEQLIHSEKMASLGQLSAGIAHEIRTPLTSIKIFIQSLEKEIDLDENQKEDFRIIKKEIDRINDNVTRFLNFARPEEPLFQQVDIRALATDTLNLLTPKIKSSGIRLDISLPEDLPSVEGDPKQLSQVFLNLLFNAIEAMPTGGTLTIRSTVKMIPDRHKEFIQLFIQDTGCGIPEKDVPYLFDPFFTTKEGGTGLGLSIVYSIVQKHNGQIEVESKLGKGSSFILSLPTQKEGAWKELSSPMTT